MKSGSFAIERGVTSDQQEGSFMNAALSMHGSSLCISVAVHPNFPADVDTSNEDAVEAYLRRLFAPLVAEGCDIEIKMGVDSDSDNYTVVD